MESSIYSFNTRASTPTSGAYVMERAHEVSVIDFRELTPLGIEAILNVVNKASSGKLDKWRKDGYYGVGFILDEDDDNLAYVVPLYYSSNERTLDYLEWECIDPVFYDLNEDCEAVLD